MSDPYRNADDPEGVAFDLMVPCPECDGLTACAWWQHEAKGKPLPEPWNGCGDCVHEPACMTSGPDDCSTCGNRGCVPNPAITQECGTCGGSGKRRQLSDPITGEFAYSKLPCPDCEGRGWTFRPSVRVAERVRVVDDDDPEGLPVAWMPHITTDLSGRVWLWVGPDIERGHVGSTGQYAWLRRDITHLWEQPCPECGGRLRRRVDGWPCQTCVLKDPNNILVPPEPGSVWEVGHRSAELVEVVEGRAAYLCGDLVLADKARKVQG